MSEGGQQLPLVSESAHEVFAREMGSHDFQRDRLVERAIGSPREIDCAHAARSQQSLRPVGAEAFFAPRQLVGVLFVNARQIRIRRLPTEFHVPPLRSQEGPHLIENGGLEFGSGGQPCEALGSGLLQRRVKQFFHTLPEGTHVCSPRYFSGRNSRQSQAQASLMSRSTVALETLVIKAVSSAVQLR